jgi:hypothetical protein
MSSTPSVSTALRDVKAPSDYVRGWYYLEHDWGIGSLVRGPFNLEHMRDLLTDGTIDDKTLVRYFNSNWHPLREVSAILATPSREATPKRARLGRSKTQQLAVLGILAIILELILVHWTVVV